MRRKMKLWKDWLSTHHCCMQHLVQQELEAGGCRPQEPEKPGNGARGCYRQVSRTGPVATKRSQFSIGSCTAVLL